MPLGKARIIAGSLMKRLGKLLLAEILEPIEDIRRTQAAQGERLDRIVSHIDELHEGDSLIRECDLASLDNQICTRIAKCRSRNYTTAEDRRIVTRMHDAYRARGGNHGEEREYALFCQLKTEEEHRREQHA